VIEAYEKCRKEDGMTSVPERLGETQHGSLLARLRAGSDLLLVGIDVSKAFHVAALGRRSPVAGKKRRRVRLDNDLDGFEKLDKAIQEECSRGDGLGVVCGVEPTGRYHKALCVWLEAKGYDVCLVSGVAAAANRRTTQGTWDHNDASDAENILDLVRQGKVLHRVSEVDAHAELRARVRSYRVRAKEVARCRQKLRNTLSTGFPEVETVFNDNILHTDLLRALRLYPSAKAVAREDVETFVKRSMEGWRKSGIRGRRLREAHRLATRSIGYSDGPAYHREVFGLLEDIAFHQQQLERELENLEVASRGFRGWELLQTIPGVGPKLAAVLLAEIGDPHAYSSVEQVLRLAGLNLCQSTSGTSSRNGMAVISHAGKAQLRWALWTAVCVSVGKDAGFKERYSYELTKRGGRERKNVKKPSLVKLMAKTLRIAYAVLRDEVPYDPTLLNRAPT
jgi:transposase